MRRPLPRAVAVGIPARDEAERIAASVDAVLVAVERLGRPAAVVVVADRCTDATVARASAALAAAGRAVATAVVALDAGSVGAARQLACAHAVELLARPLDEVWLATTDADTVVGETWLTDQWRWVRAGADGVAGLVSIDDPGALPPGVHDRFLGSVTALGVGPGHPHVHGANLGIRAAVWERCGGFPAVACAEEHLLWRAERAQGATLVGAHDVVVRTSGRLVGRAQGGFADLLADLSDSA